MIELNQNYTVDELCALTKEHGWESVSWFYKGDFKELVKEHPVTGHVMEAGTKLSLKMTIYINFYESHEDRFEAMPLLKFTYACD